MDVHGQSKKRRKKKAKAGPTQRQAYKKIAKLLNEGACFSRWDCCFGGDTDGDLYDDRWDDAIYASDAVSSAEAVMEIIELLSKFPALASKNFAIPRHTVTNASLLACFARSGFSTNILQRIYAFDPTAVFRPVGDYMDLLHCACTCWREGTRERFVSWVLDSIDESFNTAMMLVTVFVSKRYWKKLDLHGEMFEVCPHPRYDSDFMDWLARALLSKSPNFLDCSCDMSDLSRLPTAMLIVGCELKLIQHVVGLIPKECRHLNYTDDFWNDFYDDEYYEFFFETGYAIEPDSSINNTQRIIKLLPSITSLELEVSFQTGEQTIDVLHALASARSVKELSLRVALEAFAWKANKVRSLKNVIRKIQSASIDGEMEFRFTLFQQFGEGDETFDELLYHKGDWKEYNKAKYKCLQNDAIEFILDSDKINRPQDEKAFTTLRLETYQFCGPLTLATQDKLFALPNTLFLGWCDTSDIFLSSEVTTTSRCGLCDNNRRCDACDTIRKMNEATLEAQRLGLILKASAAKSCGSSGAIPRGKFQVEEAPTKSSGFWRPHFIKIDVADRFPFDGPECVDITQFLVSLLSLGTNYLQFVSDHRNHKIDLGTFCTALRRSERLKVLVLDGIDFGSSGNAPEKRNERQKELKTILKGVERGACTRLQKVAIRDLNREVPVFDNMNKFDHDCLRNTEADKLSYLLLLNKLGLATFQDGSASCAERVHVLSKIRSEGVADDTKTSLIFDLLKESPHVLFDNSKENASMDTCRGTKRKSSKTSSSTRRKRGRE